MFLGNVSIYGDIQLYRVYYIENTWMYEEKVAAVVFKQTVKIWDLLTACLNNTIQDINYSVLPHDNPITLSRLIIFLQLGIVLTFLDNYFCTLPRNYYIINKLLDCYLMVISSQYHIIATQLTACKLEGFPKRPAGGWQASCSVACRLFFCLSDNLVDKVGHEELHWLNTKQAVSHYSLSGRETL